MSSTESSTAGRALRFVLMLPAVATVVWLVMLQRKVAVPTGVEDALNAAAYAVLTMWVLLQAAQIRTKTQKVRAGWMGNTFLVGFKSFKGTPTEFVAKYRSGLLAWGWTALILGAILAVLTAAIIFIPAIRRDPMQYPLSAWGAVIFGLSLVIIGVINLRCRRILDSQRG